MIKYFYYLSEKLPESEYLSFSNWAKVYWGVIEAVNKVEAIQLIEVLKCAKISEKPTKKSNVDYKIFIVELTPSWEEFWIGDKECKFCEIGYKIIESKNKGINSCEEFCSNECRRDHYQSIRKFEEKADEINLMMNKGAIIYKITNKKTNKSYIGQTTQCFTLRWYQHFFHPKDSKFHKEIKKTGPQDWIFEVIEVLSSGITKEQLNSRESFWIEKYNAVHDGYNSLRPINSSE